MCAVAGAVVLSACSQTAQEPTADIARVKELRSSFGPEFTVTDIGPAAIDPKVLGQQGTPAGMTFEPAECAELAEQKMIPEGAKGNMAATTAEGEGNRFIVIAVETSEAAQVKPPAENCRKVGFAGGGLRGLVEEVEAPPIEEVTTFGTHRVVQTTLNGQQRTGELYNYLAVFGNYLVIVTANPLVEPGKPVAKVDTERARALLVEAVQAVRD
ncbi:putative secreted protein [Mycolicibacterium phlei]|jgi:hypothetical protein|uniref:DUF5642 domain-containing protein n=2 Tax=Mycolicibacterium phlei TaxID=1771 RepID=A0A5N5VEP1_MYCPH|nr:hypothetical protein MPHLCCUG_00994 [Mycolicibacterium phlei]EID18241.1 hypothetical protein MPHLEI_01187 [Mycolicibacterium phlei RIVM601174]KAB7759277.1 hypothetical protein MPHL21000_03405 [Mycolicibacterium phlei DSM 43239 = CCUG 21000]KXW61089.1 hypothetical protein MPHL43070_06985 [Mycolicibacterium phlei DSM 43070]KXW72012.1 hypothetical protein MPHL43072_13880 [Mycolicibacterium phlei DSM 43072]VEG07951.1 putative secreted protein [Mycobacteroides chelonae]